MDAWGSGRREHVDNHALHSELSERLRLLDQLLPQLSAGEREALERGKEPEVSSRELTIGQLVAIGSAWLTMAPKSLEQHLAEEAERGSDFTPSESTKRARACEGSDSKSASVSASVTVRGGAVELRKSARSGEMSVALAEPRAIGAGAGGCRVAAP